MAIDSKRIAKNTLFLFFRFIFILGVTFYISRVILDKLGVEDYGLYNVVFGIIGLLSFINGTLATSTSRFLTFELGKGKENQLRLTFSTALYAHVTMAAFICLLACTMGLWYVLNVLVVPSDRFEAALIVYVISILTTALSIIQVPFSAVIIANERMDAFAYIGIYDALARLAAAFSLTFCSSDKLIFYSICLLAANISVFILYLSYSNRMFNEVTFSMCHDNRIFKSIWKFSGWNILANLSNTIIIQGVILLFNIFFTPAVVAAQAISNQIANGITSLISNVRSAVNPQVVKLYANGNDKDFKTLSIVSAEFIYYLLLIVCMPCILIMPTLLKIWLNEVPEYTVVFARLLVFQLLLENFNNAYYHPLLAANKISVNSIIEGIACILQFGILYALFSLGCTPIWARYMGILLIFFLGLVEKPYLLYRYLGYKSSDIIHSLSRSLLVLVIVSILNFFIYSSFDQSDMCSVLFAACLSFLSVLATCTITIYFGYFYRSNHNK